MKFLDTGFLIVMVALFYFHNPGIKKNLPQATTIVSVTFDSIKPGNITLSQLGSIKELLVTSAGKSGEIITHKVVSFRLGLVPMHGGRAIGYDNKGNQINSNLLGVFKSAEAGDLLIMGNLVIEDLPHYKPIIPLQWVISEAKKKRN